MQEMNFDKAFTPITSLRGAGEASIGINQFDDMAGIMRQRYPELCDLIGAIEASVDDGIIDPSQGAVLLQEIEAAS